jgi:proteasome lid subunit RPN8/RPN11
MELKKMIKQIEFNGFLKEAMQNYPKESCAFLYSDKPLEEDGKWFVFSIENISEEPEHFWIPDKNEVTKVKKKARELKLIKIGNIHTHPIPENCSLDEIEENFEPSDTDLKFAKKFSDIIRGIMVIDKKAIHGIKFHDMFGRRIDILVEGLS